MNGEITGQQNQQDMDKYTHRRFRRCRVKGDTHMNQEAGRMVVPVDETIAQEETQVQGTKRNDKLCLKLGK